MIKNYPRELFNDTWYSESVPHLKKSFESFKPDSKYVSDRVKNMKFALDLDERPNILHYTTRFTHDTTDNFENFDSVYKTNSKFDVIKQKLNAIEDYVSDYIKSAHTTFITVSSDASGAKKGIKHLHPLMNQDRCNVWSFCLPLYISQAHLDIFHKCWITSQDELYPDEWYTNYGFIKSANFKYGGFTVPFNEKIFSMRFDGARSPHYINYIPHVYLWFVFDGVEYKDLSKQPNGVEFITEML